MIAEGRLAPALREGGLTLGPGLVLAAVVVLAAGVRMWFGLRLPLDADEATTGYAALGITHGILPLTESDQHYLGALEAYWLAPFVGLFGPTLLAVRLAMTAMGALYVLAAYGLGRVLFKQTHHAVLLASVAAFFPVFELSWGMKARSGYAELVVFEVLLLIMAIRLGWPAAPAPRREWVLFGLIAGLAMWNDLLIVVPLLVIVLGLVMRWPRLGPDRLPGFGLALLGTLLGFAPWLLDQIASGLRGVQALPDYSTSTDVALLGLVTRELPIFLGTAGTCARPVVPVPVAWLLVGVVVGVALWLRRAELRPVLLGRLDRLQPLDMTLAVGPAALLAVTVGRFNSTPCEPRYLLPLALPLALGATLSLMHGGRLWRRAAQATGAAYMVLAIAYLSGPTVDSLSVTGTGVAIQDDPQATAAFLREQKLEAVFADYWLARPIQFAGGGSVLVGVYAGPVGFPEDQRRAELQPHPSYLFMRGDPMIETLEQQMKGHGIQAERVVFGNHVLYRNLSAPLRPEELGVPATY
jgi:4-amino-4-deoxy-L-arabinose transferase-like glycosyltransferase